MTERAEPVRTCVGCRVRAAKSDLLRIVAVGDRLVPDPRGRLPGRGAHLHPDLACLALAERRRAFGRALRLTCPVDTAEIHQWVTTSTAAPVRTEPGRTVPEEGGRRR